MAPSLQFSLDSMYQANSFRGLWKRSLNSTHFIAGGGAVGIIDTAAISDVDAPQHCPGIIACISANGLIVLIVAACILQVSLDNKAVDHGRKKH
jgi:hypothetical protein